MHAHNSKVKIKKTFHFSLFTFNSQRQLGFTLIELLVVIAVIALVMGVVFPNFMGARQRARDTQRKSNLAQIQSALELYKLDQNPPVYPTDGAFPESMCNTCWDSAYDCSGNIYIRKFPCDPGGSDVATYIYQRDTADTLKYNLTACLENLVDPDQDPTPHPACVTTATSYTVKEP